MYRTNTCGELRLNHVGQKRDVGGVGATQSQNGRNDICRSARSDMVSHSWSFNQEDNADLCDTSE